MKQNLTISEALDLPIESVTQTFAILAKKGSGKTYTGSVMAEEMLDAGQVIVAVDPTGAWSGLRSSADGSKPAYPVVVFGGDNGSLPLNPLAGELIAQAIVAKRFSAVLDLSLLRKAESIRFVTAFMETIYRLNRDPLHLFIDEADDMCPQRVNGDEAKMVGAIEDVVKRGRKRGIGCTLITQRPADLNKQVLTQCEVLIALNISHPKDIAPINDWVRVHADEKDAKKMIADLPTLPKGEGWIWSPSWLHVFERIKIRKRRTFDSGATPEVGKTRLAPKQLAAVDVTALGEDIAKLAEEAKANDPKELKRQIAILEHEKGRMLSSETARLAQQEAIDRYLNEGYRKGYREAYDKALFHLRNSVMWENTGRHMMNLIVPGLVDFMELPADQGPILPLPPPIDPQQWGKQFEALAIKTPKKDSLRSVVVTLSNYQKDLLRVALSRTPLPTPLAQLAGLARKSNKSSAFMPNVKALKDMNLIEETSRGYIATDAAFCEYGEELIGGNNAVPTNGKDALQYWLNKLPSYERKLLNTMVHMADKVGLDSIARAAGVSLTSSAFRPAIKNLESLSFLERDGNLYSLGKMFG